LKQFASDTVPWQHWETKELFTPWAHCKPWGQWFKMAETMTATMQAGDGCRQRGSGTNKHGMSFQTARTLPHNSALLADSSSLQGP
jgi:hypothetical protein